MEINVNRKLIVIAAAILAALTVVVALVGSSKHAGTSPADSLLGTRVVRSSRAASDLASVAKSPAEATVAFAKAFYAVNYQNYDAWLAGLKAISTDDGYAILTKSIAPATWPEIERAKTVTPVEAVEASDTGLLLEGNSQIGGPWQIRSVEISIDPVHLWPTMKSGEFTALVMLAQQDGEWRFVSFITPDQLEQIKKGQQP